MNFKNLHDLGGLVRVSLMAVLWCFCITAFAQETTVSGQITDGESGEALPGVTILVKGTTVGTITDFEGNYKLSLPASADAPVLVISFVGYATQEIVVAGQTVINARLDIDVQALEEVVVVGYGTQKKSVVTGAITSVKADALENMPISRVEQALQGRTSGLTIAANSGQPGSGATVRVRGLTSMGQGSNDPLWVVDGVLVDNGGIGYLNQSDIESIEVLKDAASQAIYGARAAAGVILITTKKGKAGDMKLNYNAFYGTSAPARKLDLLNATEYATLRNEASLAGGGAVLYPNPQALGEGTDWQKAVFNNSAKRQNHELSISGGNERSTYYTSFGYWEQEGIVASDISHYQRFNVRVNSTHKVNKWLTVGENIGYAKDKSIGLGNTNSEFGGPLSSAINLDPITPLVETDPAVNGSGRYAQRGVVRDPNGDPYGISSIVVQEMTNPLAYIQTRLGNHGWSDNVIGNMFAEAQIIEGLKVRSTLGTKLAFWGNESFTPVFYLNATNVNIQNNFNRGMNRRIDYNFENTISYSKTAGSHNFNVLLGQGAYRMGWGNGINVTYRGLPVDNFDDASLNYPVVADSINAGGYENIMHIVASTFARINYNFQEKYLFEAVVRRDGSSKFGANYKFGFFPSVSAGWVVSEEGFWSNNNAVNFLKVRGGYGVVGNDGIGDLLYAAIIGGGRNYPFGTSGYLTGNSPNVPANPDLRWEETHQLNIGFETVFLKAFNMNFDWYRKEGVGMLMANPIPGYVGAIGSPFANLGGMVNRGVELELGYNENFGDLNFSVNANASYLENEVTDLGQFEFVTTGNATFQASSYPITRTTLGLPFNSFYGFEQLGIFQTQADIEAHTNSEGVLIQPNARPGDFIWADRNDDGAITEEDRTFIGNPIPKWTFGITINAEYKGFDLTIFGQGVAGNMIFQGLRRLDIGNANYQTKALGRWTGPGSTNSYPRLVDGDPNGNFSRPSDFYLEKGDYFRFKTVQLGYTFPRAILSKIGVDKFRLYLMSENLLTFTKYTGYDPEIGGGVMSIDRGIYPQARSFMMGVNLSF